MAPTLTPALSLPGRGGEGSPATPRAGRGGEGSPATPRAGRGGEGSPATPRAGGRGRPIALLLALALAGCGYRLAAREARLPGGAEAIFVRPFEDRTTDAELGALVASALRRELARRGADGGPGARALLEGAVTSSSLSAFSPGGGLRATLRVEARLIVDGELRSELVAERSELLVAGQDPLETEGRRRLALRRAAEALARELLERLEER